MATRMTTPESVKKWAENALAIFPEYEGFQVSTGNSIRGCEISMRDASGFVFAEFTVPHQDGDVKFIDLEDVCYLILKEAKKYTEKKETLK